MRSNAVWSRTILTSLSHVKSVCRQIDRQVERRAVVIPGLSRGYDAENETTLKQAERLIELSERKKRTLNIVALCNEVFRKLSQPSRKILYYRYGLKKDNEYIAKLMNVSMRTYFRNLKKAIDEFTRVRDSMGYCDLTLDNLYEDDNWILKIKDREERIRSKFDKISA
ncbi:MAG: hypothetical protein GX304_00510 [Clostridiales bacterium]|jgi:hypothetical protein|nr:hypothetical protein [Clostridiales bacterium]